MPDNEIIHLIEKIRERYGRIYSPAGNVICIEADLLLADIRELYEKMSSLPVVDTSMNVETQIREEEIVQQDEETEHNDEFVSSFSPEPDIPEVKPVEIIPEPVLEFVPAPEPVFPEPIGQLIQDPEPIPEPELPVQPPVVVVAPEPAIAIRSDEREEHQGYSASASHGLDLFGAPLPTLADKFGEEKRSVNEKIHTDASADKSIGSKLRQPVTDLKTSIGINDRFLFINELFDGDMRIYDETLSSFNSCASLQDALAIFENTKISRGWAAGLEPVDRLLDFIHRRFA